MTSQEIIQYVGTLAVATNNYSHALEITDLKVAFLIPHFGDDGQRVNLRSAKWHLQVRGKPAIDAAMPSVVPILTFGEKGATWTNTANAQTTLNEIINEGWNKDFSWKTGGIIPVNINSYKDDGTLCFVDGKKTFDITSIFRKFIAKYYNKLVNDDDIPEISCVAVLQHADIATGSIYVDNRIVFEYDIIEPKNVLF